MQLSTFPLNQVMLMCFGLQQVKCHHSHYHYFNHQYHPNCLRQRITFTLDDPKLKSSLLNKNLKRQASRNWSWLSVCGSLGQSTVTFTRAKTNPCGGWMTAATRHPLTHFTGRDRAPHTAALMSSSTFPRYITFLMLFILHTSNIFYWPLQEEKLNLVRLNSPASRSWSWHLYIKSLLTLLALSSLTFAWMQPSREKSGGYFLLGSWGEVLLAQGTRPDSTQTLLTDGALLLAISNGRATATWQHGV